jgi:hypothetical protein
VAAFDGGLVTSDAGALLLGATDRALLLQRTNQHTEADMALANGWRPIDENQHPNQPNCTTPKDGGQ